MGGRYVYACQSDHGMLHVSRSSLVLRPRVDQDTIGLYARLHVEFLCKILAIGIKTLPHLSAALASELKLQ